MKNKVISKGIICLKNNNIEYYLCTIEYHLNSNGTFKYVFKPNYEVIDLLRIEDFDGIPGLDISLRKEEYIRDNMIPTFISERVPSENREDYFDLLKERNMEYMDPVVYLIRSKKFYSGDYLYVKEYEDKKTLTISVDKDRLNTKGVIKNILQEIAKGNDVVIDGVLEKGENKQRLFKVLMSLYNKWNKDIKTNQMLGISHAKKNDVYKGRKPKSVESIKLKELYEKVKRKEISSKKAAELLDISIYKYYREINKLGLNQ